MKNVGVAMNEFKSNSKLGNFPDDITADRVVAQHNYMSGLGALQGIPPMTTSASFWESNFYAKVQTPSGGSTVTPDGEIYDGKALTPGEVGFSYVMRKGDNNKKVGIGSSVGEYPLMVTSVLPGEDGSTVVAGNAVRFDPESFRGKVLIFSRPPRAPRLWNWMTTTTFRTPSFPREGARMSVTSS